MPTIHFQHRYEITDVNGSPVLLDIQDTSDMAYTEPLEIGDSVEVTDSHGSQHTFYYYGVSVNGEVLLAGDLNGGGYQLMLSNIQYDNLVDPPPNFDPVVFCFLSGTRIATPAGETAVETLTIGDLVLTTDGRSVPVKWLGRQTVATRFGISERRRPVSITAGALEDKLPTRELRVTADHALMLDGVLVQAGALVNHSTIRRIPDSELGQSFMVYHIETENHELVVAEGVPAETFIDNVIRRGFDNYAEYEAMYGASPGDMTELEHPRAMSPRQVPSGIRARVAARAEALHSATSKAA